MGNCVQTLRYRVAVESPFHRLVRCVSHYRLLVVEPHSQVLLCTDTDTVDGLLPLMHLPAKDSVDFYSLGDIMANGQKLDGAVINILAAVKTVRQFKAFI